MGKRSYVWTRRWIALLVIVAVPQIAIADYITLKTGATIYGEIVEETREAVSIRTTIGNITSVVSYRRELIDHYVITDRPARQPNEAPGDNREPATLPAPSVPKPKRDEGAPVVVIPLHGQVGGLNRGRVAGTFDADMLRACFREAHSMGASLVVLDINSPGGYVDEMEAICEMILAWSGRLRIVGFPQEAYSAAAVIALGCPELAVPYDSRIGAAVMMQGGSALDAKRASPHYAKQRQFMAASGKPYEVLQAMTIQETELWWAPGRGFRTEQPPAGESNWELVDGRSTVLTMTGEQARRWGVADFMVGSIGTLAQQAGIREPYTVHTFTRIMQEQAAQADRRLEELERNFRSYFQGLGELYSAIEAYMKLANDADRRARDRARNSVRRSHGKVLATGSRIRDIERSVVARRLPLPELLIERLEEDAKLLGMVRRLVNSDSPEQLSEAAQRFNAVILAWRELLQ